MSLEDDPNASKDLEQKKPEDKEAESQKPEVQPSEPQESKPQEDESQKLKAEEPEVKEPEAKEPEKVDHVITECEPFLFRYIDPCRVLLQPLDIFGLSLRTATHELPIPKSSSTVRVGNTIFFTGGENVKYVPLKIFLSVSFDFSVIENAPAEKHACTAVEMPDMPAVKAYHGCGVVKRSDIVVIGGFIEEHKETTSCYRFDYEAKKWIDVPALPKALANISVESINGEYLYTFGGSNFNTKASMVILKYIADGNYWDALYLKEGQEWDGYCGGLSVKLDEDQILLFGGEGQSGPLKVSYIFNDKEKTMKKAAIMGGELVTETDYPVCKAIYEGKVYCVHEDKCHIYDIEENAWSLMRFESN